MNYELHMWLRKIIMKVNKKSCSNVVTIMEGLVMISVLVVCAR